MNLSSAALACLFTVSSAALAVAGEKPTTGAPATVAATSGVTVEPTNAVISAGSAQVISKTGAVTRINRGDGLVELTTGTELSVGDTVFAGPGSTVTLYYPATGCEYLVPSETYFAVAAAAPCGADAGASSALQKTSTNTAALSSDSDDTKTALLVGGAVVIGGGILAVIALTGDDDDNNGNPASPN